MQDRLYTRATWGNTDFVVVDTGGLMSKAAQLPDGQRAAAERAISAAGLPQVPCHSTSDSHTSTLWILRCKTAPVRKQQSGCAHVLSSLHLAMPTL